MGIETVKGQRATIVFDAQRCIHSRHCVLSHPDVFVPNVQGDWIHPDAQPEEVLMRIAQNCPSGAISVVRHADQADSNTAPMVNTVRVRENGPLAFEAQLQINGQAQTNPRATLCRCGQSNNKPFCDGSHVAANFVATGEPVNAVFAALERRDGPLDVKPLPNGPLQVSGPLEVVTGTGRTCNKVNQTHLCRCGQSRNKPYCDGSHVAAGFNSDEQASAAVLDAHMS